MSYELTPEPPPGELEAEVLGPLRSIRRLLLPCLFLLAFLAVDEGVLGVAVCTIGAGAGGGGVGGGGVGAEGDDKHMMF